MLRPLKILKKPSWFIIITIIVIIAGINRSNFYSHDNNVESNYCDKIKKSEAKGIVIKYGNRDCQFILTENQCFTRFIKNINIDIGDSICKDSGTFDFYIYKNSNPDSSIYVASEIDCYTFRK